MAENMMMNDAPQQSTGKSWKTYAILAGVALILALGASLMMSPSSEEPRGIAIGDQNSIIVGDQEAGSLAVAIDQASFITPGFIVIHEDVNGTPGKIVGVSALFQPGFYTKQSVIANLKNGANYIAMLHGDNGNGIFGAENDAPLNDPAGAMVSAPFKVKIATTNSKG